MRLRTPLIASTLVLLAFAAWTFSHESPRDETRELAEHLRVGPGSVVADVGAGDGEWSQEFARLVGAEGRVFATEVDSKKLRKLRKLARRNEPSNLEVVEGDQSDTGLAASCCDAILLRLVYHHFDDPDAMLGGLRAALRPGGRIAIVDFPPGSGPPRRSAPESRDGHGLEPEVIVGEMTGAGFELLEQIPRWQGHGKHYLLVFEKPSLVP